MTAADDLRALSAAATPGPWDATGHLGGDHVPNMWTIANRMWDLGVMEDEANAELVVWLRNHADSLVDLIAAASNMLMLHDEHGDPWAPSNGEFLRRSLAALEADDA